MSSGSITGWSAWWERTRTGHPVIVRRLKPVIAVWAELSRVELVDRSLALGAQALLALIPLLMVLGAGGRLGAEGLGQVQDVMGVPDEQLQQLAVGTGHVTVPSTLSVLVAIVSATSFSRGLQRMYAHAWRLPRHRGARAFGGSLLWIPVWILMLQTSAALIRWTSSLPFNGLAIQIIGTPLVWWWTAHLLLGGRVSWSRLLPGAVITGALLVVLSRFSRVVMPTFVRANLEQFGSLGIVFAVATWLVTFGGVLIVATVLGRFVTGLFSPMADGEPRRWRHRPHPDG